MKLNKKYIVITIIASGLIGLCALLSGINNINDVGTNSSVNSVKVKSVKNNKDSGESVKNNKDLQGSSFLKAISGVKAEHLELVGNPVGVKGEFIVPKKSLLNGVDYFLKDTNNDKMDNIKIDIGEGFITLNVDYKISKNTVTPIEVNVVPSLNANRDLELKIKDVKLLDLRISDWLVNMILESFIKDWFPADGNINIEFNDGSLVINKDNFDGIDINKLAIEPTGLSINMLIDLNKTIANIAKK